MKKALILILFCLSIFGCSKDLNCLENTSDTKSYTRTFDNIIIENLCRVDMFIFYMHDGTRCYIPIKNLISIELSPDNTQIALNIIGGPDNNQLSIERYVISDFTILSGTGYKVIAFNEDDWEFM